MMHEVYGGKRGGMKLNQFWDGVQFTFLKLDTKDTVFIRKHNLKRIIKFLQEAEQYDEKVVKEDKRSKKR